MLQLQAALMGDLEGFQEEVKQAVGGAARETMEAMRDMGIGRLRSSLKKAGLGSIEKTWRGDVYPARGFSMEPALFIHSKAPHIIAANQGEVIRGRNGNWLAIPIPGSPAEDLRNPRGPDTKVDAARQRYGERLFTIPAKNGRPAMLAVEGVGFTKTGRMTLRQRSKKTGAWGSGTMTVPLFWLVPQASMQDRLDVEADFRWIEDEFAREYPKHMAAALVRAGLGN